MTPLSLFPSVALRFFTLIAFFEAINSFNHMSLKSLHITYRRFNLADRRQLRLTSQLNQMMTTQNDNKLLPEILALDFDGVICASSIESSFSSIIAAQKFWPSICKVVSYDSSKGSNKLLNSSYSPLHTEGEESYFCRIRKALNILRPIVETGFENMLLVRLLHEELHKTGIKFDSANLSPQI